MADPGILSSQIPPGEDWLVRRVADLERAVRELTPSIAKSFAPVIADLTAKQTAIEANLASINTLITQVAAFGANGASAFNFALSTTSTAKASMTVPIPAGFTRALVHATVNASVENTSAAYDYFYVRANITAPGSGGSTGGQGFVGLANGGWDSASASAVTNLSGLTPGSITVSCLVNAGGGAWAAATSNTANVDASITFLK